MQSPPHKIGMPAHQIVTAIQLNIIFERIATSGIQFRHLLQGKVGEGQPCSDVKGRLVQVGDEQVGFGRVGNGERQPSPGAGQVERNVSRALRPKSESIFM